MKSDKLVDAIGGVREEYVEAVSADREVNLTLVDGRQAHGFTRRNFVRMGVAAAAVGVGAFLGLSLFGKEDTLPVFGDGESQYGFVLTAYANEMKQILEPGDTGTIPLANYTGDFGQGPCEVAGMYDVNYYLILTGEIRRAGTGMLTYELEGPHAQGTRSDGFTTEPRIFFEPTDVFNYYPTSISTPFGTDGEHEERYPALFKAHFPITDALQAAIDSGDKRAQLLEARHCFNALLAETTLRIKLEYNDGSVIDQRCIIEPVADFDAVCGAYLDELLAAESAGVDIATGRETHSENGKFITPEEVNAHKFLDEIDAVYMFYTIRYADA